MEWNGTNQRKPLQGRPVPLLSLNQLRPQSISQSLRVTLDVTMEGPQHEGEPGPTDTSGVVLARRVHHGAWHGAM